MRPSRQTLIRVANYGDTFPELARPEFHMNLELVI